MTARTPGDWERTKGEALLDLDFAIELSVMSQRLYERLNKAGALLSLLAGSAAFVTIFQPNSVVVTIAGIAVGVIALVEQVYDFRGKAATHAVLWKRFMQVKRRSANWPLAKLDVEMDKVAEDTIPVVQGLRMPAHNHNMRRNGFPDYIEPLNRWERLLDALV